VLVNAGAALDLTKGVIASRAGKFGMLDLVPVGKPHSKRIKNHNRIISVYTWIKT